MSVKRPCGCLYILGGLVLAKVTIYDFSIRVIYSVSRETIQSVLDDKELKSGTMKTRSVGGKSFMNEP